MRVLLIGPGIAGKYGDKFFYSYVRRLNNGFIRNGHFVFHASDRDLADSLPGGRLIGAMYANRRISQIAASLRPDLVVLVHADIVTERTLLDIRRHSPGVSIALVDFDPLATQPGSARLRRMAPWCDVVFATTGGQLLKRAAGPTPSFFIHNLVDVSIDNELAYENAPIYDVFFAGQQRGAGLQWSRALELKALAPDLRYGFFGANKRDGIWGADFISALGRSAIGLNLNRIEGDLYASDRMGQYLGNGVLLATDVASGYADVFKHDEMIFFESTADLSNKIKLAVRGGAWRAMAERARRRALETMSSEAVCRFICKKVEDLKDRSA